MKIRNGFWFTTFRGTEKCQNKYGFDRGKCRKLNKHMKANEGKKCALIEHTTHLVCAKLTHTLCVGSHFDSIIRNKKKNMLNFLSM